jgi:ring-1,2-phenylacetyl-CoA epoxidase subunit PaaD
MVTTTHREPAAAHVWDIAAAVSDPEIPVLTIEDLGILRGVRVFSDGAGGPTVEVTITPTYSGCPAIDAIRDDVLAALSGHGYENVRVQLVLSPAWTTDWMTDSGRAKLEQYGIAPPSGRSGVRSGPIRLGLSVRCPQCSSFKTHELSRFGSTSCKALYVCLDCKEPFDYFKVL